MYRHTNKIILLFVVALILIGYFKFVAIVPLEKASCSQFNQTIEHKSVYDELLYNPLDPSRVFIHDKVFKNFQRQQGSFNSSYIFDWLGIETNYSWDCIDDPNSDMHYSIVQPSRLIPCRIHEKYLELNPKFINGALPIVDDEYEELVDVLYSVLNTPNNYVMMELGARYGTWGVRALKAWHQLRGIHSRATFVGVESNPLFYKWMQDHVTRNNLDKESILHNQFAMKGSQTNLLYIVNKSGIDHIDLLDTDIQSSEGAFFDDYETMLYMDKKVAAIHIGTHTTEIHDHLKKLFEEWGWIRVYDYPLGYGGYDHDVYCDEYLRNSLQTRDKCTKETKYGKMYIRDGILSYRNPRYKNNH